MDEVTPDELRKKRESKGLTQYDVAKEVGIHPGTVSKIESGDFFRESTVNKMVSAIEDARPKDRTEAQKVMSDRIRQVSLDQTVSDILDKRQSGHDIVSLCIGDEIEGWIKDSQIQSYAPEKKVSEVMNTEFEVVSPRTHLDVVLDILQKQPLVIVLANTTPVGVITRDGL